ncbi:hypothetical protein FisN_25Lh078 [Fistulifera solaris]|uniref:Sulfotransferase domain-containing protein n=1 Tax=Fistulifera solaris TaxID=1519565 RepID=A0A1Z5K7P5_FISSO|nr:hypothetical protein FisN_25Lh078 [Fistulifera solaris]|eukprot:GAX22259.1 hypothetical protein FisN_25Lh078 [Fistulifera solaris]
MVLGAVIVWMWTIQSFQTTTAPQIRASVTKLEIASALEYVNSFKSLKRTLKFFHIPKTAGTAIEQAAGQKVAWGSCLFKHKPIRHTCSYPAGGYWPSYIGWWHIPSQFFPIFNLNPYQDAELFGVIRDPFDRMVSEFYYICSLKVKDWRPDQCNRTRLLEPEYMNEWLQNKLHQQHQEPSAEAFLTDNGHFTPQYDFIFGPHQVRMLDYVLKMDDGFGESFDKLMAAFLSSDIKLEKFNAIGAQERDKETHLNVKDLNRETLSTIQRTYEKDLSFLGYSLTKDD